MGKNQNLPNTFSFFKSLYLPSANLIIWSSQAVYSQGSPRRDYRQAQALPEESNRLCTMTIAGSKGAMEDDQDFDLEKACKEAQRWIEQVTGEAFAFPGDFQRSCRFMPHLEPRPCSRQAWVHFRGARVLMPAPACANFSAPGNVAWSLA